MAPSILAATRTAPDVSRSHSVPPLRAAVIGVGYLGRFHAQKYAALPDVTLCGVVDADPDRARVVGEELGVPAYTTVAPLLEQVDLVSIVVPTQRHFEVARQCLEHGLHVLLEKPMTVTVEEADILVRLAEERGLVLQVGHLERFNPAMVALQGVLSEPLFIESHRVAPFNPRGADVNVVLDLMIHDIDLILEMVPAPITSLDVSGVPVLTGEIDIANARLRFANGCVANVTASRAGRKTERIMRVFQHDAYIVVDFHEKHLAVHRRGPAAAGDIPEILSEERRLEGADALLEEVTAFVAAVRHGTPPVVSGRDGRRALETAIRITEALERAGTRTHTAPASNGGVLS